VAYLFKSLWIPENKISRHDVKIIQESMDRMQPPTDIGRVPHKIDIGEYGFSSMTADQWWTFILYYAVPTMWTLLPEADGDILAFFTWACTILSS
jgi:hypothetical protein